MTRYAVGQPIRLSTVVADIDGVTADPSDISVTTLCTADATTASYTYSPGDIVRDSLGHFHLDLTTLTTVGHYAYVWLTTGTNAGAGPAGGTFEVYDPLLFRAVSIEDARAYLRLVDGSDVAADDARLADIIGAVTAGLIRLCGPLVPTTYTEVVHACDWIQLGYGPARSITSITAASTDAVAVAPSELQILPGDVVRRINGSPLRGWYTIVYRAGTDTIADDVRTAGLDWVLHKWRQAQAHASATYGELIPDFEGPPNSVLNGVRHYLLTRSGV